MLALLNNRANGVWYDIHSETLALLLYGGLDKTLVRPVWVADLLAAQQQNGGFLMYATSTESEAHSTVLALWALLAYQALQAVVYKWICR